jgi:hypothetical protein
VSQPNRLSSLLEALGASAGHSGAWPPRNRDCARCTLMSEEHRRYAPRWQPTQCESWYAPNGLRYWSGTCATCADIERQARSSAKLRRGAA